MATMSMPPAAGNPGSSIEWRPPNAAQHRRKIIRWGFGDAVWCMVAGIVAAQIGVAISVGARHGIPVKGVALKLDALDNAIAALSQFVATLLVLWLLVGKRGRGLRNDLGFSIRWKQSYWLFIGMGASIAVGALSLPIANLWDDGNHGKQQIGEELQRSASWARVLLVIVIVVLAPIVEELVFRGVVLRSALRRMPAVGAVLVSGAAFGAVHPLFDLTTFPSFPSLMALGVLSAVVAVRSGNLTRSIFLHMGFNALGAISLLTSKVPSKMH